MQPKRFFGIEAPTAASDRVILDHEFDSIFTHVLRWESWQIARGDLIGSLYTASSLLDAGHWFLVKSSSRYAETQTRKSIPPPVDVLAIELGEIPRQEPPILPDQLTVEVNFSTSIVLALNRHHIPMHS